MPYKIFPLPEYPLLSDMWEEIKNEKRPIVVYGMGNGADKLFDRLDSFGVKVSDVFASDGFVRGHSFRGYRVKSFSEIKETYADFVILLSFASNREDDLFCNAVNILHGRKGRYLVFEKRAVGYAA